MLNVWGKIKELISRPYIVESGSNANGSYIKWSNGTMICTGKKTFQSVAVTQTWGNINTCGDTNNLAFNNFAKEFAEIPIVNVSAIPYPNTSGNFWLCTSLNKLVTKNNPGAYQICRGTPGTMNFVLSYVAIGPWK